LNRLYARVRNAMPSSPSDRDPIVVRNRLCASKPAQPQTRLGRAWPGHPRLSEPPKRLLGRFVDARTKSGQGDWGIALPCGLTNRHLIQAVRLERAIRHWQLMLMEKVV